jgi:SWI/SNF-related matrix-associated actin-dependent regulator of chromatin subfamily A3
MFLLIFFEVIDVKAQLKNTNLPQGYAFAQATAPFRDFQVVPDGGYYSLEYYGNKFAVLNKKTCGDFRAVLQSQQVRLHAYVEGKEWSETVKLWQKYNNSTIITVEINIYGAREIADEVGKVISTFGTFLQQPRYGLYGVGYYNPHYFRVPGFENVESLDTPIITIEEPSSFPIQSAPPDELADPSREVSSILDSLSHHDFLKERAADVRIRRPLLS